MYKVNIRFMNKQDLDTVAELAMLANPHVEKVPLQKAHR